MKIEGRERSDRIPLGRDSTRSVAGVGGRTASRRVAVIVTIEGPLWCS